MPAKKNPMGKVLSKEEFKKQPTPAPKKAEKGSPVNLVKAKKEAEPSKRITEKSIREPYKAPTPSKLPEGWQDKFLDELALRGNVSRAARIAGVSRRTAQRLKGKDTDFEEAWEDAIAESKDRHLEMLQEYAEMGNIASTIFLAKEWNFNKDDKGKTDDNQEVKVGW